MFLAFSFLPYPGSSEEVEITDLPTREVSDDPIIVDIKQTGPDIAWKSAFGFGWHLNKIHSIGFSILCDRDGINREIFLGETPEPLSTENRKNTTLEGLFGYRFRNSDRTTTIASSLTFYGTEIIRGSKRQLTLDGFETESLDGTRERPISLRAGVSQVFGDFKILGEFGYTLWRSIAFENDREIDYFNTSIYVVGFGYRLDDEFEANVAYGSFPSHIGDGIMESRAADGIEIEGVQFGSLNASNIKSYSIGFRHKKPLLETFYYVSYQKGDRFVFEDARYYGDHSLSILMFGAGGNISI